MFMKLNQGDDAFLAWTAGDSVTDCDNIVHLLARDLKWTHLARYHEGFSRLLDLRRSSSVSLDLRDCDGMTALALSIQSDNVQAAKALLDHGASLGLPSHWLREGYEDIPLEIALEHSPNVRLIAELLRRSRDAGLSYGSIDFAKRSLLNKQALRNIKSIISSSKDNAELEDAFYVIQQLVLHTRRGTGTSLFLGALLKNWDHRELSSSILMGEQWALRCLSKISKSKSFSCDDLIGSLKGIHGTSCHCATWTRFAIFHVEDEAVVETLLADRGFHAPMTASIITPCPVRIERPDAEYFSRLLGRVLDRTGSDDHNAELGDWRTTVVMYTPPEMAAQFWTSLAGDKSWIDIHARGIYGLAISLVTRKGPLCWQLAELVLSHDPGHPRSSPRGLRGFTLFSSNPETDHRSYASISYLDYLCHWATGLCVINPFDLHCPTLEPDWINTGPCGCHTRID